MQRMRIDRLAVPANGESGSSDLTLELAAPDHERVDRAAVVWVPGCANHTVDSHGRRLSPVGLRALEAHAVSEQQLGDAVTRGH
jgi:hypothetical protein